VLIRSKGLRCPGSKREITAASGIDFEAFEDDAADDNDADAATEILLLSAPGEVAGLMVPSTGGDGDGDDSSVVVVDGTLMSPLTAADGGAT
jgi:hypothetical protein